MPPRRFEKLKGNEKGNINRSSHPNQEKLKVVT